MRLGSDERRRALASMPRNDPGRTMLRIGITIRALAAEPLTEDTKQRLDTELRPQVQRVQAAQQRTNMRGITALLIARADETLASIIGDWQPRADNPIDRECRTDLGVSVLDL